MSVTFTDIDYVLWNIGLDYKDRILMTSDIESLSLADGIELSSVMSADDLAIRVLLVTGLLDMLSSAAIGLCLEPDVIVHRLRQSEKVLV